MMNVTGNVSGRQLKWNSQAIDKDNGYEWQSSEKAMMIIDGKDHKSLRGKYTALGTQQMDLGTSGNSASPQAEGAL